MKVPLRFVRACLMALLLSALVATNLAPALADQAPARQMEQIWLAVSDIHLDLFDRAERFSPYRTDTNVALFESAVARMQRAAPNARVILLPGDLLAHDFARNAGQAGETPDEAGVQTMRWIARAFARAFPRAQIAIALGNNDVPCGDYKSANGSAYLAAISRIWQPLVDRGGASPDFSSSFTLGGSYVVRLPLRRVRLLVLNTVLLSSQYRGDCRGDDFEAASRELAWLQSQLRADSDDERNIVMMHIPPGFDVASTDYVRKMLAWPFLKAGYNVRLTDALAASTDRVEYAIAGHTHRFDFRLAGDVPIVVLGSLSPIYGNDPTFNVLRVLPDGSLRDIDVYAYDEYIRDWVGPRSFDHTWGSDVIDGPTLARLHARLENDAAARARWNYQAEGWPTYLTDTPGAWSERRWRISWCAQRFLVQGFAACAGVKERENLFSLVVAAIAVALTVLALYIRRHRRA